MPTKYWYTFTGTLGDESHISAYTVTPTSFDCPGGFRVCKIYALYGVDTHPLSFSQHIHDYIAMALVDGLAKPRGAEQIIVHMRQVD